MCLSRLRRTSKIVSASASITPTDLRTGNLASYSGRYFEVCQHCQEKKNHLIFEFISTWNLESFLSIKTKCQRCTRRQNQERVTVLIIYQCTDLCFLCHGLFDWIFLFFFGSSKTVAWWLIVICWLNFVFSHWHFSSWNHATNIVLKAWRLKNQKNILVSIIKNEILI